MPLTISAAWTQRGWSANDHLIDDSRMNEIIGKTYQTLAQAKRAVAARADKRGYGMFRYTMDGKTYCVGLEPNLPGRPNYGPREVTD